MMTKTSLSRYSSLLLVIVLILSMATPVAAVTVMDESVDDSAAVGDQITATVTLGELYQDPELRNWELRGETNLTNVTWTVFYYDQTGSQVAQESFDGQSLEGVPISTDDGTDEVEIRIEGTVPAIESYRYDPPQEFRVIELTQARGEEGASTDIGAWQVHHYTEESDAAREALDDARAEIDASEADTTGAEDEFENAVDAFESGNFDLATTLANEAQEEAMAAQQSNERRQLLIYGVIGIVLIGIVVAGIYYYQSRGQTYDRLG